MFFLSLEMIPGHGPFPMEVPLWAFYLSFALLGALGFFLGWLAAGPLARYIWAVGELGPACSPASLHSCASAPP
jgi:hypothetical protein